MSPRVPSSAPALLTCPRPGLLEDSWQRSLNYGLHRDDDSQPWVARAQLKDARAENSWIGQLVAPQLSRLAPGLNAHPSIIVLSDATGLVLETHGNSDFLHKAQRYALSPGNLWGEHARGTNAIGTALALGRSCEIAGSQHYLNRNAGLTCSAMPVFRPDGQIAGVLDLSTPAASPHPDAAALIRQAVIQIEHAWVSRAVGDQRWLLSLRHDAEPSAPELLFIVEDDVLLGANRLAMEEFGLTPAHFGATSVATLFPHIALRGQADTLVAQNQRRYLMRQTAPARRIYRAGAVPPAIPHDPQKEKALRILNAGIALCVTGETGCGKEHVSRELHARSTWRNGPFVAINCAALPEQLIESELFGYVPGAFTGSSPKGHIGKLREANGGVLFLDEIGDMPPALQTRLLRVLQEKKVTPLGSNTTWEVNFALICATHQDLAARVEAGAFREDLLYRIQEFHFHLPPLRDWPHLADFIRTLWNELGASARHLTLSDDAVNALAQRPWPGNVRQLMSQLRVVMALADDGALITRFDLPTDTRPNRNSTPAPACEESAIADAQGNMSEAAKKLGISRSTLYRRLEKRQLTG